MSPTKELTIMFTDLSNTIFYKTAAGKYIPQYTIYKQVLYITVGATVESSVPLHYVHLSFSDDWFDNRK